jgi:muramoyltetrapeptide carboxypeptidase
MSAPESAGRRFGIGLYAPAGFATDPAAIDRAVALLSAAGHRVTVDPTCRTRWQRFSAPDDERLAAVLRMAADPDVELAVAVRGGYGWSRLLDRLDFATLAASGTRWMGHSDFTAFQLAALAQAAMTTFAGPMASYDFGAVTPSAFTLEHCWRLLGEDRHVVDCALEGPDVACEGTLWGGNLALVAHLVGTPYLPAVDAGILFLEDVGEHPYRVERMLHQLRLAGILARQRAILLGTFNGCAPAPNDNGYDFGALVEHVRARLDAPVFTGLAFGHRRDKLTLPVGGHCALTVRAGAARLVLSGYAAREPLRRFRVRLGEWPGDERALRSVRNTVFVTEQHVPEALEWDGLDPVCRHAVAEDARGNPIGCGRLLPDGHVGRMAVLREWRGRGVGTALLAALVELAREMGHRRVALNAQASALPFYARHGFAPFGPEFEEAGIAHRAMERRLR